MNDIDIDIDIDNDASREFDYIRTRLELVEHLFDELAWRVKKNLSRYIAFWKENRIVPPEIRAEARRALIELVGHLETANHEAKALHSDQFKELYKLRDNEISKRYQDGMTMRELALEYGLSRAGVELILNRARIDEYGVRHELRPCGPRPCKKITTTRDKDEEQKRQILTRYPRESMRKIAISLDIPMASVARVLRLAGVPTKTRPTRRKSGGPADRQMQIIRTL